MDEVKVEVWRLVQDSQGKDVVLLRDEQRRHLPIWIGPCEAAAIWVRLAGGRGQAMVRRPMTHDLCVSIIERLGGAIQRVVIDDYSNETYNAKIYVAVDGSVVVIDSRPSDAIALALRCEAPVWVSDSVMEAGNVAIEEDDTSSPSESPGEEPDTWADRDET